VANAETPGFKRLVPVTRSYESEATRLSGSPSVLSGDLLVHDEVSDRSPGILRSTGRALDLALEGSAYFVVGTSKGEALMRRGDLAVDADGYLVSHDHAARVLGVQGPIRVGSGELAVAVNGEVRAAGNLIDRLRVVLVGDGVALQPMGPDLHVMPTDGVQDAAVGVRQGFLEGSNVQSVNEMVRVMETMRHFEALQRGFRTADDLTQKAISELGKTQN
jgi:flagellar basal-body rod protein FlgF